MPRDPVPCATSYVQEPIADAWRLDADGAWTAVELDVVAPVQAMATMWSSGDGHVWIVDAYGEQLRLLRIDPRTGQGTIGELDGVELGAMEGGF